MWLRQKVEPVVVATTGQTCSGSPRQPGGGPEGDGSFVRGISWKEANPHSELGGAGGWEVGLLGGRA